MYALRRHYVREVDESATSSPSLPDIPAKWPNRVIERDEID